jgi:ubiquinone/menaquinone biosynthesis C-methylase UbiE
VRLKLVAADVSRRLPLRTASLERIYCFDLVEHIPDIPALMAEIHRVLRPNGSVLITTPHFSCANAHTDPTHRWRRRRSRDRRPSLTT